MICSPELYKRKIGFVISGECEVCRYKHDGGCIPLNTLVRGDSFGISTIFSDKSFPTVIYAKKRSEIFFIDADELLCLIERFPAVALNIIKFQNDRIAFLNNKIETFSAGTAEERLACFLLTECKKNDSNTISLNRKKTSEILGIGRASL